MPPKNYYFGKGSVVVPSDGEEPVYRLAITADRLVTRPFEGIDVIPDIVHYTARTHGCLDAMGWRDIVRIHEEVMEVKKTVAGKQVTELKKRRFFELSDFKYINFLEVQMRVLELARGLLHYGIQKTDVFNIYAQTSVNWQLMSFACATISTPVAAVYDTVREAELTHTLNEPECVGIFTNARFLATLTPIIKDVPVVRLVVYDGEAKSALLDQIRGVRENVVVISIDELREIGRMQPIDILDARKPTPDDVALIMYTNNGTGAPKGVVLTHGNIVASLGGAYTLLGHHLHPDDAFLAYLPLAHILEYVMELTGFTCGMKTGYGRLETLMDASVRNCKGDIVAFRPTIFIGMAEVWETIRKGILAKVNASGTLKKALFNGAMAVMKAGVPGLADVADAVVLSGVRAATGGRLRLAFTGGAELRRETQEFLSVALVTLLQAYWSTELCALCAVLPPELMQYGVVGLPMPSIEIKLVDIPEAGDKATGDPPQGEICIRGPAVTKGYYKRPDLNEDETIFTKDGWSKTGDVGQWNPDGTLGLINQAKNLALLRLEDSGYNASEPPEAMYESYDLVANMPGSLVEPQGHGGERIASGLPEASYKPRNLVANEPENPVQLQGGEYIALERLEATYKSCRLVADVCVHASAKAKQSIAIIFPNENSLRLVLTQRSFPRVNVGVPLMDLCHNRAVQQLVLEECNTTGKRNDLKLIEMLAAVILTTEEWTLRSSLSTAAQKVRRSQIARHFEQEIKKIHRNQ